MDVGKIVQYWLTTAVDDLEAAEHLLESQDYTHALFFGHLYLEKLFKAQVVGQTGQHAATGRQTGHTSAASLYPTELHKPHLPA